MSRRMKQVAIVAVVLMIAVADSAFAGSPTAPGVPEISPTSLSAGLAMLAGGVLMMRARRRK